MEFHGLTLDKFQEDSINAIEKNESVVVSAPTGSGKTLIADYIIHKHKNDKKRIIYTAPIKALSNQKYKDFSREYGADKIGLMTGDIVINPTAKVVIMTTEVYRNMAVSKDEDLANIAYVIFDEVHYINDIERGYVWEESIIYSRDSVRFLCLSATIPNAKEFANWIKAIKKHPVQTVVATKRNVPLKHSFFDAELGITTLEKIKSAKSIPHYDNVFRRRHHGKKKKGKMRVPEPNHVDLIRDLGDKLPCLFFSFSRRDCQMKARELARKNLFEHDRSIIEFFNKKLEDAPSDISRLSTTKVLKETLLQGIGFHHAGLLPVIKEAVEELFGQGKIKVLYTTETFAVGINMPAKTVCFASLRKYDGVSFRMLNTKEYFQIAGRAGRRGIDKVGYVVSMIDRPRFDYHEIKRLTDKDMEPIKSQFKISVNSVLNLIDLHSEEEIAYILRMSFYSYQKYGERFDEVPTKVLLSRYNSVVRKLKKYGYVVSKDESAGDSKGKGKKEETTSRKLELTKKGDFSARVFADEFALGEIFATDVVKKLDEYQILLLLAALVYEPRVGHKFKQKFGSEELKKVKGIVRKNELLGKEKKFLNLDTVTTLVHPIYNGKTFFDVLELTSLLEGDLIRFYTQIMDRIGQIRKTNVGHEILQKIENCEGIVEKALEGIYLV